ncbi:MAG TPA: hypothetical protein DDW52_23520 [Planctomycetaceae bacterium]|nr:hypothetical protein [Planctomycetaceae bacterium]
MPSKISHFIRRFVGKPKHRLWRSSHFRPHSLERLEARELLATFLVTNTSDSGEGSFRQAILDSNSNVGPDRIEFAIEVSDPGFEELDVSPQLDAFIIRLATPLPEIDDTAGGTTIDGYTQVAKTGLTNSRGPQVIIDGSEIVEAPSFGLVARSDDSTIAGLGIQNFSNWGIIGYGDRLTVLGNHIGVDALGRNAVGNGGGIRIVGNDAQIGSDLRDRRQRNVISGNAGNGIEIRDGASAAIQGNYIGTDQSALVAIGNSVGIQALSNAESLVIGTNLDGENDQNEGNIVSGNDLRGIQLFNSANLIAGNRIGVDRVGQVALGSAIGIDLEFNHEHVIGGPQEFARNIISGNTELGIRIGSSGDGGTVVQGNFIGTNLQGSAAVPNQIGISAFDRVLIGGTEPRDGNVISGNSLDGIFAFGSTVRGNLIGLNAEGNSSLGNGRNGVRGDQLSIGGAEPGAGNVISGNESFGIEGSGLSMQGNLLGYNVSGTSNTGVDGEDLRNQGFGIGGELLVTPTSSVPSQIGGTTAGAGNRFSGGLRIMGTSIIQGNSARSIEVFAGDYTKLGGGLPAARNIVSETIDIGGGVEGAIVQGNYVGVDATGTTRTGLGFVRVGVQGGATNTIVGSDRDGSSDLLEGNLVAGVVMGSAAVSGTAVVANLIGTDATGSRVLGDGGTVSVVEGASSNRIEGNVIAGTLQPDGAGFERDAAVFIDGYNNTVVGNFIGTDATGKASLGNLGHGVYIRSASSEALNNQIGWDAERTEINGNTIVHSGFNGIGTKGNTSGHVIRGNRILASGELGIDLNDDGVTPNNDESEDSDVDGDLPNRQNFPVLNSAQGGAGTRIQGSLSSFAEREFVIDFYANTMPNGSGFGEGERWLGELWVATDVNGNVEFDVLLQQPTSHGEYITATATRTRAVTTGNNTRDLIETSEFSEAIPLTANQPPVANTGGPYRTGENVAIQFDASMSFDPNQSSQTLMYEWDFDYDGFNFQIDAVGLTPSATFQDNFPSREMALRVTDSEGLSDIAISTLAVDNLAPTLSVQAPPVAVPGQTAILRLNAFDPSPSDQSAGFVYTIDWDSDGLVDESLQGGGSIELTRTFLEVGRQTITVMAIDQDEGTSSAASVQIEVDPIAIVEDPLDSTKQALAVGGTDRADFIRFLNDSNSNTLQATIRTPGRSSDSLSVNLSDTPITRLLAFGLGGRDFITIGDRISIPSVLFGGSGNDTIIGGNGSDAIFGDDGRDRIFGRQGRDLVVGGLGRDRLSGNGGEDILIGGKLSFQNRVDAALQIIQLWNTEFPIEDRKSLLGASLLVQGETVLDDEERDRLFDLSENDWGFPLS